MELLLKIILAWIVISIPVSLIVGRLLAGSRRATEELAARNERPYVNPQTVLAQRASLKTGQLKELVSVHED